MRSLRAAIARVAGLLRLTRRNAEIDDELRAHFDMLVDDHRRRGQSETEARRLAAAEFGSVSSATEAYRDRRSLPAIEHWWHDCRAAVRSLAHTRILSAAMLFVLAMGVGLATTLATLFHAVLFRPLAVPDADRVVKVAQLLAGDYDRRVNGHVSQFSWPEFDLYRHNTHALADVAAVRVERATWLRGGERRPIGVALVTPNYFRLLATRPAAGRLLGDNDAAAPVVVIGHRLWTDAFAQDSGIVGTSVTIDRARYLVIGVAERSFTGTDVDDVDAWLPLEAAAPARGHAEHLADASLSWLQIIGRIAPDASLASAAAEAHGIAAQYDALHPGQRTQILVMPAARIDSGVQAGDEGKIIAVGVAVALFAGVVLLICTSNAAALLLARGAARQREFALRLALGASRGRIIQQLLIESLVLAVSAAALGLALTTTVLRLAAASLPMSGFFETFAPDATVIAFAIGTALVAAILFGVAPAIFTTRIDPMPVLKGETVGFGLRMPASRMRHWIVAAQVAVSLVLLVLAALLGRQLQRALGVDDGIAWSQLYAVDLEVSPGDGASATRSDLVRRLRLALDARGDLTTGLTAVGPFSGIGISQARSAQMSTLTTVRFNRIDAGYFHALGVSPVVGRAFDTRGDESVSVVNARLARVFWGDERAAIGQTLSFPDDRRPATGDESLAAGPALRIATVIGVVPTLQSSEPGQLDGPTMYLPIGPNQVEDASFVVRAPGRAVLQSIVDGAVGPRVDATLTVTSLESRLQSRVGPMRVAALVAVGVGLLTLLVAGAGIYGIVAHAVVSRRYEIGVHVVLGAPRARVLRLVLGSSFRAIATGAAIGTAITIIGAVAASSVEGPTLLAGQALDPMAILAGIVFLVCVSGLAAYWPARKIDEETLTLRR